MSIAPEFRLVVPTTIAAARAFLLGATPPNRSFTQLQNFSEARIDRALRLGLRNPAWVWAAEDEQGERLGVVAGWGAEGRETPFVLDFLSLPGDRPEVSRALLERAARDSQRPGELPLELIHFLPMDSATDDPDVASLIDLLERTGFRMLVRRHRYRMTVADAEVRIPPTELRFEQVADAEDPRLVQVFEQTLVGSLDAHDVANLQEADLHQVAVDTVVENLDIDPIDSWFLAHDAAGDVVGLVIGGLRGGPDIGSASFIGVSNLHRGKGYAGQLLGWITARMIDAGAAVIIGETDDQNFPMAAAFTKIGYPHTESRIDFRYSSPDPG
jgi:ribosomal protein S18 acetylase RimI-like enzyme